MSLGSFGPRSFYWLFGCVSAQLQGCHGTCAFAEALPKGPSRTGHKNPRGSSLHLFCQCYKPNIWVFGVGLFLLGLICALLSRINKQLQDKLDRTAYRYAGVTLAITILIQRSAPIWIVAMHRFFEVSIGIAVALIMTAVWREKEG